MFVSIIGIEFETMRCADEKWINKTNKDLNNFLFGSENSKSEK